MIHYHQDTNHIVTLTLDKQGTNENIIDQGFVGSFNKVLDHLQGPIKKDQIKGLIITSAKKDFIPTSDFNTPFVAVNAQKVFDSALNLSKVFRRIEKLGIPIVAAINGSAGGSGLEFCFACHFRICLKDPNIRLRLPDVEVGLMPISGATTRLMWILGIKKTYEILTQASSFNPQEAYNIALVDELANSKEEMLAIATDWIKNNPRAKQPWDLNPNRAYIGSFQKVNVGNIMSQLAANVSRDFNTIHHNTPLSILNVLAEVAKLDFNNALKLEAREYTNSVLDPNTKNMLEVFYFEYKQLLEGNNRPKGFGKFRPKRIGIIGAGVMGSSIAYACLTNNMQVILKDVNKTIARTAYEYNRKKIDEDLLNHTLDQSMAESILSKLSTTDNAADFADCDLIIEAVFENENLKSKVIKQAEEYIDEYTLIASNTVSIPITQISASSSRPENFVGMHFFRPVETTKLVEVVRGQRTTDESVARAIDFVKAIGKIPIIAKDEWGFYAQRVQNTYLLEGVALLQDGVPAALIENLSLQAGMSLSPLALADEFSLPLVLKYENQASKFYGKKYQKHPAVSGIEKMIAINRKGKKKSIGFYDYSVDDQAVLWQGLKEIFESKENYNLDNQTIVRRLLWVQVIEAAWCYHEGVIGSMGEANLGSVYGWGFPRHTGGVFQYAHTFGLDDFVEACNAFKDKYGPRFRVPKDFLQLRLTPK